MSIASVILPSPFDLADTMPVCGFVAGPRKPLLFDKGLKQGDRLPVLLEKFYISGKYLGGEMFHPHPGENEKPDVVDDLMQIAFPGCLISADKSITAGHFPGGGTQPRQAARRPSR